MNFAPSQVKSRKPDARVSSGSPFSYSTWFGRAVRLPLRLIPADTALPILRGLLSGKLWISGSSVHGCWLGCYETEKSAVLNERLKKGSVVFDIGAQAGYHTLLAARLVEPGGMVYAFEPMPRNIGYLRKHIAMHALSNVVVIEAAVADYNGTARFDYGFSCMAGHLSEDGALRVPCLRLDQEVFSGRLPMPDVLKIDVEGAELKFLNGARSIISQRHPEIVLDTHEFLGGEFSAIHAQCCQLLTELGYRLDLIGPPAPKFAREVHAWVS
jgi:FkbM family methyltransferase